MRSEQDTTRTIGIAGSLRLGKVIQEARERRRWSRYDLACLMSVSESMITKIENGRRPVYNPETVRTISESLEIEADEVYALQSLAPPDVIRMVNLYSGINLPRLRKFLALMIDGRMVDDELGLAVQGLPLQAKDILIPRKRTRQERLAWERINADRDPLG